MARAAVITVLPTGPLLSAPPLNISEQQLPRQPGELVYNSDIQP